MTDQPLSQDTGAGDGSQLFVRQATGLVRELSVFDNAILSASYISIFLGFTYLTLVPSTFTGANIALAFALTFVLCVPHFITYGWLSSAMPRSGGEYLFLKPGDSPLGRVCRQRDNLAGLHRRTRERRANRATVRPSCDVRVSRIHYR